MACSTPMSICEEIAEAACARAEVCDSKRARNLSTCEEREKERMQCAIKTQETVCLEGEVFQVGDMERCLRDIARLGCDEILSNDPGGGTCLSDFEAEFEDETGLEVELGGFDGCTAKAPPTVPRSCDFCVRAS
ncbi:MAG: hypothetical protein FWB81_08545 [Cystobacterineae bacterium]|nr:hypothetical protein [Cystobacterineae bacterium]